MSIFSWVKLLLSDLRRFNFFQDGPKLYQWPDISAESSDRAFLSGWVTWLSVTSIAVTEQDRQFESIQWKDLLQFLGTTCQRTTAHHQVCVVEMFHQHFKTVLMVHAYSEAWVHTVHLILLRTHFAMKECGMTYGSTL